jgi:hypothetical protein
MANVSCCGSKLRPPYPCCTPATCSPALCLPAYLPACVCQVIAINTADPKAAAVNSLEDVERWAAAKQQYTCPYCVHEHYGGG